MKFIPMMETVSPSCRARTAQRRPVGPPKLHISRSSCDGVPPGAFHLVLPPIMTRSNVSLVVDVMLAAVCDGFLSVVSHVRC